MSAPCWSPHWLSLRCAICWAAVTAPKPRLFLDSFADGTLLLARLSEVDMLRMAALVRQYSDMRLGASDASIVALGERLNVVQVATLDRRHFTVVRPVHCNTFS